MSLHILKIMCIFAKRIMKRIILTYMLLFLWIPLSSGQILTGNIMEQDVAKHRQPYFKSPRASERLVVVSRPQFAEMLQPYISWKRQAGYQVHEYYADSNDRAEIKAYLQRLYDSSTTLNPYPRYILIVGDVEHIQSFIGRHKPSDEFVTHITDMYYGEYTGDHIPEAMVGRWSIGDSSDLRIVMTKSMSYEQGIQPQQEHLKKVLLVAGREFGTPAPTTTNGQVNYEKERILEHDATIDTHCFYNPTSKQYADSIAHLMANGIGYVNYTGHCNIGGWLNPNINNTTIGAIEENGTYGIYINNCCSSNAFGGSCFGERLLRKATGGAVAVIGSTNETLWNEDYIWSVGAKLPATTEPQYDPTRPGFIDRMLHTRDENQSEQAHTMGELLWSGNYAVTQSGSRYDAYYWEIYSILGDPTLMPYIGKPDSIEMRTADTMEAGISQINIRTNVAGATVTATTDSALIGWTRTDSTGSGVITLTHGREESQVVITATAQFHTPRSQSITIVRPTEARNTLISHQYTEREDSIHLELRIKNIGQQTAEGHHMSIRWDGWSHTTMLSTIEESDTLTIGLNLSYPIGSPIIAPLLEFSERGTVYFSSVLPYETTMVNPYLEAITFTSMGDGTCEINATAKNTLNDTLTATLNGDIYQIGPHERFVMVKTVQIEETAHHIEATYSMTYEGWQHTETLWFILEKNQESYESGDFNHFPWQTTDNHSWQIDSTKHHQGRYSAKSHPIGHNQRSDLCINLEVSKQDSIVFWSKVSSEDRYDRLLFYVDDSLQITLSGERPWERHAYLLTAGRHHLQWRYEKDDSRSEGNDGAWVDNIQFPPCVWDAPYGYFDSIPPEVSIPTTRADHLGITLTLYPNPATRCVTIKATGITPGKEYIITIYDQMGKALATWNNKEDISNGIQYSTTDLRLGVYFIELLTSDKRITERLTVIP